MACCANAFFAVGGEGDVGGTGMSAVEGPFCFALGWMSVNALPWDALGYIIEALHGGL